jgi:hypothetical protein
MQPIKRTKHLWLVKCSENAENLSLLQEKKTSNCDRRGDFCLSIAWSLIIKGAHEERQPQDNP